MVLVFGLYLHRLNSSLSLGGTDGQSQHARCARLCSGHHSLRQDRTQAQPHQRLSGVPEPHLHDCECAHCRLLPEDSAASEVLRADGRDARKERVARGLGHHRIDKAQVLYERDDRRVLRSQRHEIQVEFNLINEPRLKFALTTKLINLGFRELFVFIKPYYDQAMIIFHVTSYWRLALLRLSSDRVCCWSVHY